MDWGFPFLLHPDEYGIRQSVRIASTGNLDPHLYNRPDHILIYLNAFVFKVFSYIKYHNSSQRGNVQYFYNKDHLTFTYLARLVTTLFGSLLILSMFFLGKEMGGVKVGLLASFFTAFFPSFIEQSHFSTPDIPLTFFISMTALYTTKFMKKRKTKFLFLGCVFCGLATMEKYPGLIATSMIACAVIFTYWNNKIKILKWGTSSLLVYFSSMFVFAPFLFLNYKKAYQAIVMESRSHHLGLSRLGWGDKLLFYLDIIHKNMGSILFLFLIFGVLFIFIRVKRYFHTKNYYLSLFVFGAAYWVLMSKVGLYWERFAVPMYIVTITIASVGINTLQGYLKRKDKIFKYILFVIFIMIILSMFLRGLNKSLTYLKPNTQNASKKWIDENLPKEAKIVADGYTPLNPGHPSSAAQKTLKRYKKENVDFIIVSSFMYERYLKEKNKYPHKANFYKNLFQNGKLIKRFSPDEIKLGKNDLLAIYQGIKFLIDNLQHKNRCVLGPEIRIYELK